MIDYTLDELNKSIKDIVNKDNEVVFIAGNIAALGRSNTLKKKELLNSIYSSIMEVSKDITIVVPSLTMNLCNTDKVFSKNIYTNMGAFSNFIIQMDNSIRSIHPFASYTAIGKNAKFICGRETPYPYGLDSPYDNILKLKKPLMISIGMEPNLTCSIIHHVEFNMHVPYRYIKEFYHPVKIDEDIKYKNFYLHVLYKDLNEKRNLNIKAFSSFKNNGHDIIEKNIGKSKLYSYSLKELYDNSIQLYQNNIYTWLDEEPSYKPYRK